MFIELQHIKHSLFPQISHALNNRVLFVGGFVRDAIKGYASPDVDIVTDLKPHEVSFLLNKHNIDHFKFGIQFGTVTVIDQEAKLNFEITSLRKDVIPLGRKAIVQFGSSVDEDALRRDFTINALYADLSGKVYDVTGLGLKDLQKKHIRFIGDPKQRIIEDSLRIMRYFRFLAGYGNTKEDSHTLEIIKDSLHLLDYLSKERIVSELYKLLSYPCRDNMCYCMYLMDKYDILKQLWSDYTNIKMFFTVIKSTKETQYIVDKNLLFGSIFAPFKSREHVRSFQAHFHLPKKTIEIIRCTLDIKAIQAMLPSDISTALYLYGKEEVIHCLHFMDIGDKKALIKRIVGTEVPVFDITGKDALRLGIPPGTAIKDFLSTKEKLWIDSGFSLSKEELLKSN